MSRHGLARGGWGEQASPTVLSMTYPNDTNRNDRGMTSGTPSGGDRPSDRDEFYSASEASKVLGITPRRVRALAQEGRIEGERTEGGWMLFRRSVHSFRDSKRLSEMPQTPPDAREWIERTQD